MSTKNQSLWGLGKFFPLFFSAQKQEVCVQFVLGLGWPRGLALIKESWEGYKQGTPEKVKWSSSLSIHNHPRITKHELGVRDGYEQIIGVCSK